jgi:hypothetical protein
MLTPSWIIKNKEMKILKIVLFVTSLLGVGFVVGFYAHRYVVDKKIEKVAELRFARGFQMHLFDRIGVDEEQKTQLAPIVEKYAQQMGKESRDSRQRRREIMDSLYKEIKPLMSEEQIARLEDFSRRFRQKERDRREKMPEKRRRPENVSQ